MTFVAERSAAGTGTVDALQGKAMSTGVTRFKAAIQSSVFLQCVCVTIDCKSSVTLAVDPRR